MFRLSESLPPFFSVPLPSIHFNPLENCWKTPTSCWCVSSCSNSVVVVFPRWHMHAYHQPADRTEDEHKCFRPHAQARLYASGCALCGRIVRIFLSPFAVQICTFHLAQTDIELQLVDDGGGGDQHCRTLPDRAIVSERQHKRPQFCYVTAHCSVHTRRPTARRGEISYVGFPPPRWSDDMQLQVVGDDDDDASRYGAYITCCEFY